MKSSLLTRSDFMTHRSKQEKDDSTESQNPTDDCTPEDTLGRIHRSIFGFFSDVARCIESNQNPRCGKI